MREEEYKGREEGVDYGERGEGKSTRGGEEYTGRGEGKESKERGEGGIERWEVRERKKMKARGKGRTVTYQTSVLLSFSV